MIVLFDEEKEKTEDASELVCHLAVTLLDLHVIQCALAAQIEVRVLKSGCFTTQRHDVRLLTQLEKYSCDRDERITNALRESV